MPKQESDDRMHVYVVNWREEAKARPGDDADSFIRREGPAAFEAMVARAKPHMDYVIDQASEEWAAADIYERSRTIQRLTGAVKDEPDVVIKAHYRSRIALLCGLSESEIEQLMAPRPLRHRGGTGGPKAGWVVPS